MVSMYNLTLFMLQSPEKLKVMRWQDKIEANSLKIGAKFIDYRPETGSWVFEVRTDNLSKWRIY